jgi:hypothetical protein
MAVCYVCWFTDILENLVSSGSVQSDVAPANQIAN